jgi:hypothetical protein
MTQPESMLASAFRRATEDPDGTVSFESVAHRVHRRHRVAAASSTTAVVAVVALAGLGSQLFRSTGRESPLRGASPSALAPATTGVLVSGQLRLTGGPSTAGEQGTAGTVLFRADDGTRTTAAAASDGAFSVRLKPGEYTVTGTSFAYGDGKYVCLAQHPVTVSAASDRSASSPTWVLVACDRR